MNTLSRAGLRIELFKLAHPAYTTLRKVLTAAGLAGPIRSRLGPLAGRVVSNVVATKDAPPLVQGHKMALAAPGRYPPAAMALNRYEAGTTALFQRLIHPGMVVIDIGAHVGYYSLLAARQAGPTGKVYAFEPEPENHRLLLGNIQRNGYINVTALRQAVSNRVGPTALFLTALDNGRHSAYRQGLPESGVIEVSATTLDVFLDTVSRPRVGLVKVDVEGGEMDVLDGMGRLLQESPSLKLIMEYSPTLLRGAAANPLQLLDRLRAYGFQIYRITEKKGPVALPEAEWPCLVERLSRREASVNILCAKQ